MSGRSKGGADNAPTKPRQKPDTAPRTKKSNVSHACEQCRKAKTKCNGKQPCLPCQRSSSQCEYTARDFRSREHRVTAESAIDLQLHKRLLTYIWDAVQQGRESNILTDIRSGMSIDEAVHKYLLSNSKQTWPPAHSQPPDSALQTTNDGSTSSITADENLVKDPDQCDSPTHEDSQTLQSPRFSSTTVALPPGSARGFGNLAFSSAVTANHFSHVHQQAQLRVFRQPEWQLLPCWTFDDSALGQVYTTFQRMPVQPISRTIHLQNGASLVNVSFLFAASTPDGVNDPDAWASQLHRTFTGHVPQTVLVAGAYMLAMLMRWLIDPTPESYEAVPLIIRPTLRQRLLPHPSSIDLVTMAPIRDALIDRMRDFVPSIVESELSVNWPRTVDDALVGVRQLSSSGVVKHEYFVSPDFAAHVSDQNNWIFGRKIFESFPELVSSELAIRDDEVSQDGVMQM